LVLQFLRLAVLLRPKTLDSPVVAGYGFGAAELRALKLALVKGQKQVLLPPVLAE